MKKVLIADESAILRHQVRYAIARTEVAGIFDFDNGEEALRALRAARPSVIVIGHQLDDMSGLDLSRHIRAQEEFRTTPLILLSPNAELEDVMEAVDNGIDDFVVLPFDEVHLATKVRAALARADAAEAAAAAANTVPAPKKGYARKEEVSREP